MNEHRLPNVGCTGESPLDFGRLRDLKHKPVSFKCSDGDMLTVCTESYATSSPTSAAESNLSKPCRGAPKGNVGRMKQGYNYYILFELVILQDKWHFIKIIYTIAYFLMRHIIKNMKNSAIRIFNNLKVV